MEINITAIVQARMGANRLPKKMMLPLHGIPVVEWVFQRIKKAKSISNIIFAVPDTKDNDILSDYLKKIGATVYRGSEKDVVKRFYFAAREWSATHIVRVCADNPFVSGAEIDRLVQFFFESNCDYAYNHIPKNNSYPNGIGAEIVSFKILQMVFEEAKNPECREHVFNFIWEHSDRFNILTFDPADERLRHPELKLDIDTQHDFIKLCLMKVNVNMEAHQIVAVAQSMK